MVWLGKPVRQSCTAPATAQVDKEHVRVQQLRHKVANCQAKVKQLKGTKQAVQVISSTKYPIEEGAACQARFTALHHICTTPCLRQLPQLCRVSTPCTSLWSTSMPRWT